MSEQRGSDPGIGLVARLARAAEAAAEWRRQRPRRRPEGADDETSPPSGWIEDGDFVSDHRDRPETLEDQDRRRRVYSRQVCIRLSVGQFSDLEHAAELYGVAKGTMARVLVRRGARAVVEHHQRYDLEQGGLD